MVNRVLFVLGICIVAGCTPDSAPTDIPVNPHARYLSMIEDVREKVQSVRQLHFLKPISVGIITRDEYAGNMINYPRYYEAYTVMLKQLCLIPDTMRDVGSYVRAFNAGFPAAYYSWGTDSITLINPADYDTIVLKEIIAHEFSHALQDQHFNIDFDASIPYRSTSNFNSDYYTVGRCLAEGDAVTSELNYLKSIGLFSLNIQVYCKNKFDSYFDSLSLNNFPQFLKIKSMFPYKAGAAYVAKIQRNEGWKSIDSLYHAKRALSTAEIVTGESFEPSEFDVSPLVKDWYSNSINVKFADDDNYGPVWLMAILNKYITRTDCSKAFGWRGDRFVYMLNDDSQWGKFVWALNFKEGSDAVHMFQLFDTLITSRVLGGNITVRKEISTDSLIQFNSGSIKTCLIRNDRNLFWIENIEDPVTVASSIMPNILVKRGNTGLRIIPEPELIYLKKQIINNKFLPFTTP
jgi:hypothetical protein